MLAMIKTKFKTEVFSTIIHVNVKLKEAQNEGTHIFNYDKYCRGAKDYYSLSRELIIQKKVPDAMPMLERQMKQILKERLPKLSEVLFKLNAPEAKEVYITGEFNNWKVDESTRMSAENGNWMKKLNLGFGTYRYRFVIDGKWTEDPSNPTKEVNPYGEMDSLIEVSKQ